MKINTDKLKKYDNKGNLDVAATLKAINAEVDELLPKIEAELDEEAAEIAAENEVFQTAALEVVAENPTVSFQKAPFVAAILTKLKVGPESYTSKAASLSRYLTNSVKWEKNRGRGGGIVAAE